MSTDTEDVWTFNYDPEKGFRYPIKTACEAGKFGYPNRTVGGEQMFANCHFRTEAEAWDGLVQNAEAHVSGCSSDFRYAQQVLRKATDRLAVVAAFASEVREAYRDDLKKKLAAFRATAGDE